ncbi:glycosyltransferase [Altibacter sp. HG106]|uniref:glycosyltransferase n=1 Tax=Altibacter sp. HG106 TaxID=3023937 RepID=UPI002350DFEF|nr:glycosyltransferase [Altibacter sp. HG106]MDC7995692.1 glycosyltransferase [Altibacter sp. HG106]
MRVLQLIDSLDAGGAERMAVTLANALVPFVEASYLITTRKEGVLKATLAPAVGYLFLNKKRSLDVSALGLLKRFVRKEKITHVHAHTTSYFLATQLKIIRPEITLIWHEHHGKRVDSSGSQHKVLRLCSRFFTAVITVNEALQQWCQQELRCNQVHYLPNIVPDASFVGASQDRPLRIVCLANLREPKNHLNLLRAFQKLSVSFSEWTLVLVGADYQDAYSEAVYSFVKKHALERQVDILGKRSDVSALLRGAAIGVLSSDSEGLPMALLEYGAAGLAVVATNVGQCSKVISTFGRVVPKDAPDAMKTALQELMADPEARLQQALAYQKHIKEQYAATALMPKLIELYLS